MARHHDTAVFLPESLTREEAQLVWDWWRTGVFLRKIPPSWCVSIEHPRVVRLQNAKESVAQVRRDCELFAGSMLQSYKRHDPKQLTEQYVRAYRKLALSPSVKPTVVEMTRLLGLNGLTDNANCFTNHFMVSQTIDELARHYQIPLARTIGGRTTLETNGYQPG